MKLREKIQLASEIPLYDGEKERLEKIADDFAIGFAEWVINGNISNFLYSPSELLEIYKQENEL